MVVALCPNCGFSKDVPANYEGKRAKCPKCKTSFAIAGHSGPHSNRSEPILGPTTPRSSAIFAFAVTRHVVLITSAVIVLVTAIVLAFVILKSDSNVRSTASASQSPFDLTKPNIKKQQAAFLDKIHTVAKRLSRTSDKVEFARVVDEYGPMLKENYRVWPQGVRTDVKDKIIQYFWLVRELCAFDDDIEFSKIHEQDDGYAIERFLPSQRFGYRRGVSVSGNNIIVVSNTSENRRAILDLVVEELESIQVDVRSYADDLATEVLDYWQSMVLNVDEYDMLVEFVNLVRIAFVRFSSREATFLELDLFIDAARRHEGLINASFKADLESDFRKDLRLALEFLSFAKSAALQWDDSTSYFSPDFDYCVLPVIAANNDGSFRILIKGEAPFQKLVRAESNLDDLIAFTERYIGTLLTNCEQHLRSVKPSR